MNFFRCTDKYIQESDNIFYDVDDYTDAVITAQSENSKASPNLFICHVESSQDNDDIFLVCEFSGVQANDFIEIIKNIQNKIFLAAPKLFKDIIGLLGDKQVSIQVDFTGVKFSKIEENGNIIELYPDDFIHGELKRLSLYIWLKFNKIEDAIVLMDEVEIALHPDWQYQIVNDLQTWAPNNQYTLATHSYELCQALTPAHVKEIEPKLLMKKQ